MLLFDQGTGCSSAIRTNRSLAAIAAEPSSAKRLTLRHGCPANLYLTGNGVIVFNAHGKEIEHIFVPAGWIANVTFGGEDRKTLLITHEVALYGLRMRVEGASITPDFNHDYKVDIQDLLELILSWGQNDPSVDIAPPPFGDGVVDEKDLEVLMSYWGQEVPDPTLLTHWKLDETEGTVAHNATGDPVYNATLYGDPSSQPSGGRIGGALAFDSEDDRVSSPFVLNPAEGAFSVFAWVKGGAPGQVVLSHPKEADWLMAAPDGGFKTGLTGSGRRGKALASPAVITDDAWHRTGLVWDGSNRILYVDDIEVARDTPGGLTGSTGGLAVGAGANLAPGSFWSGLIDDVRVYNRAVQPSQRIPIWQKDKGWWTTESPALSRCFPRDVCIYDRAVKP